MSKNFIKNYSGKIIFLIIGVCISLTIYGVRAAWDSPVTSGQTLTRTLWNDIVAKLVDLDTRVENIETSDSPLRLIASASNWTEECRTILSPNGDVSFQPDSSFGGQSVNVYNQGWGSSFYVHEVVFEIENQGDDYCVGVNQDLNLGPGATNPYPTCTRILYRGTTPTSAIVGENDWITLWVNGTRQLGCPGDAGGNWGHPRYGKICTYPINGTISELRIEEADWSQDFSIWKYKIWFR